MGTFKSETKSFAAQKAKLKRMCETFYGSRCGLVGFATFVIKSTGDYKNEWYIEGYSSYHSSETLAEMYRTNGKIW